MDLLHPSSDPSATKTRQGNSSGQQAATYLVCMWERAASPDSAAFGRSYNSCQEQAALRIQAGGYPVQHAPYEGIPCSCGVHNGLLRTKHSLSHLVCQDGDQAGVTRPAKRKNGSILHDGTTASRHSSNAGDFLTLAMPAAVATATEACTLCCASVSAPWLLYSRTREDPAFDTAAAEAASSALRLTASMLEASRAHVRRAGPSEAAATPSLQP